MRHIIQCILVFCIGPILYSQSDSFKEIEVKYRKGSIKVDGKLDDTLWEDLPISTDFFQYFPTDSLQATKDTEIRMFYNNDFLYVGIKMHTVNNQFIVNSLQRDFRAGGNDNISIIFDTFNDGQNAFLFGLNPFGVQREALITNGG